jgi:hypothetical protein
LADAAPFDAHVRAEVAHLQLQRGEISVRESRVLRIPRAEMIAVELDQPFIGRATR